MPTRININNRIISTISIKVKAKRIRSSSGERVPADKSACTRIVISCPKINSSYFSIIVFPTITERIGIVFVNILLNTKSVISISFCNLTCFISKINNITVSVLGIVSILRLIAVSVVVFSDKICASDVAVFSF